MEVGARQMTQLVNVLAAKHKNQSLIPRIHMLKRERQLTQTVFWLLHISYCGGVLFVC